MYMYVAICMQSWLSGHACMVHNVWTISRYMPSVSRRTFHIHLCPVERGVSFYNQLLCNICEMQDEALHSNMLHNFICLP